MKLVDSDRKVLRSPLSPLIVRLIDEQLEASDWRSNHSAVFVDPSGSINFLANTPVGSLQLVCIVLLRTAPRL